MGTKKQNTYNRNENYNKMIKILCRKKKEYLNICER